MFGETSPETMAVSATFLASLFSVTEAAVMKWVREGGMPKGEKHGRYNLKACIEWRIRCLVEKASDPEESDDLKEERRKLIVAQRHGQELNNARERAELLDANLVASAIHGAFADVATGLDSLGPRIAGRVAMIDDPGTIQKMIFDECRNIRRTAAGRLQAFADSLGGGEDPGRPAKPKRRAVGGRKPRAATGEPGAGAVAN